MVCTYQNPQNFTQWVVTEASPRPRGPRRNEDCHKRISMANIQSPSLKGRTFRTNIRNQAK